MEVLSLFRQECELDRGEEGLPQPVVSSRVEHQLPDGGPLGTDIGTLLLRVCGDQGSDLLGCVGPVCNSAILVGGAGEDDGARAGADELDSYVCGRASSGGVEDVAGDWVSLRHLGRREGFLVGGGDDGLRVTWMLVVGGVEGARRCNQGGNWQDLEVRWMWSGKAFEPSREPALALVLEEPLKWIPDCSSED